MKHPLLAAMVLLLGSAMTTHADGADELLKAARQAWQTGQGEAALQLATQAVAAAPKSSQAHQTRGQILDGLRKHQEALAEFNEVLRLDPQAVEVLDQRGSTHFKLGKIKESLADFDSYLSRRPEKKPGHWRRGITCYYAGEYEEGRKQFEGYDKVDANDVENAVWRYLCMARSVGVAKAQSDLLKIGNDRRVPMMQVYALFSGKAKPQAVLEAAKAGNPTPEALKERLFYAHLYLGLYYEAQGDKKVALEHLKKAAEEYPMGHYMWEVARVHVTLRK